MEEILQLDVLWLSLEAGIKEHSLRISDDAKGEKQGMLDSISLSRGTWITCSVSLTQYIHGTNLKHETK